jgi:hypothetical protein
MERMRRVGRQNGNHILVMLAVTLMIRMLVPQGWMPASGGRIVTMCSGMGVTTAWVDARGNVHKDIPNKAKSSPCLFSMNSAAVLAHPYAPSADTLVPVAQKTSAVPYSAFPGLGLAAPPPPATGPPLLN